MYTLAEIEALAMAMSPDDRAKLADALLVSLAQTPPPQVVAAWELEIAERLDAYDRGDAPGLATEAVFAEARRPAL